MAHPAPATAELPVAQPEPQPRSRLPLIALALCATTVAGMTLGGYLVSQLPKADPLLQRWPFVVVGVSVGLIIVLIAIVRLHAFLALVLAALSAGLMSSVGSLSAPAAGFGLKTTLHWLQAVELTAAELGKTAGGIGIVVALASIIGVCLLESGSADKVVRRFLAVFGEKRAGFALLLATYVVSIPIFFDTLFMLLVPIAQALWLRTRKDYMLFVMAICCAGVITHSMVIPHPGPLAMVEALNKGPRGEVVDVGLTIVMGLASGIVPLMCGWVVCRWANRTTPIDPPQSLIGPDAHASLDRPESELPSFLAAITPVLLPVVLIAGSSFINSFFKPASPAREWLGATLGSSDAAAGVLNWLAFVGERHVALLIGTVIAVAVLMKQKWVGIPHVAELMSKPLETAGIIILITSAGGAFGGMLRNTGVGEAIKNATAGAPINLILLGWGVAVIVRVAQGSATIAMLTTAAVIAPLMNDQLASGQLAYHPVYLFLAIGYGAFCCSWMNDSGFWVVSRLGGLTERQTLRSWTVLQTVDSVAGLGATLVLARLVPMRL